MKTITCTLVFLLAFTATVAGAARVIDDFASGISPVWEAKVFNGKTLYKAVREDGVPAVMAQARGTASGLFYKIKYDPKKTPWLTWKWKVDHVLKKGDARTKKGDDYAARVYVVFPSLLFWRTKAINYIWANRLPKGAAVPNRYTANAMMVAVESGPVNTGRWITEKRNILADYRRLFKEDPPKVGAIAIMTDTDTTGEEATAWYGAISISERP